MQAMRHEVSPPPRGDICEWCESKVGPFHQHHVKYQFSEIVLFFLEANKLNFDDVEVCRKDVLPSIVDRELAYRWGMFHAQYAEYETLCRSCHYEHGHGWKYEESGDVNTE